MTTNPTLFSQIQALGSPLESTSRPSSGDLTAWFAAAQKRPAFELWGKAYEGQPWPAHPLLCHMLDVAAVAALLVTTILPPRLVQRLLGSLHTDQWIALRLLLFLIAQHDIGKATPAFQEKVKRIFTELNKLGYDAQPEKKDLHHGDIGLLLLAEELKPLGFDRTTAIRLARTVTAHHGQFPTNVDAYPQRGHSRRELGMNPRWDQARKRISLELLNLFDGEQSLRAPEKPLPQDNGATMIFAGLTTVADWLGSMDSVFTYEAPPENLRSYWTLALDRAKKALKIAGFHTIQPTRTYSFSTLFPSYEPWPLHVAAEQVAAQIEGPSLVVIEAPMGEGKTEASLLLSSAAEARGDALGMYVGLPTQATANQMLGRVQSFLEHTYHDQTLNLLLAHGEAALVERFQRIRLAAIYNSEFQLKEGSSFVDYNSSKSSTHGAIGAEEWFLSKKRVLLADHAVGTIDQSLLSVMLIPHNFVRLFGLAGKTVILDEVHAYDTYTSTLLERLLSWLAAVGTSVVLLSATLPQQKKEALLRAYQDGIGTNYQATKSVAYPRITSISSAGLNAISFSPRGKATRPSLEWAAPQVEQVIEQALTAIVDGGCVGCIFNTVARAQQGYDYLRKAHPEIVHRLLIHARLLPEDRNQREQTLERWLGPERRTQERPEKTIVIGTQVLEQSLDIDFDVLFTDLAPIDLILQRAGRLFRHERSNRHPARTAPRLIVIRPEQTTRRDLDEVAVMYPEILLQYTLDALRERKQIYLPEEIEPLVEQVYQRIGDLSSEDIYQSAHEEHLGVQVSQRMQAYNKVLPRPIQEDDIFGTLKVFLDEHEDPLLHQQLRAATRLGDPTIELICIERLPSGQLSLGDTLPFDLDTEPDRATTLRLVRRSIGVSRKSIVRVLQSKEYKIWEKSAILRYRRPVIFEEGRATVGDTSLLLDPELGLVFNPSPVSNS